jgi:hypothetical protein
MALTRTASDGSTVAARTKGRPEAPCVKMERVIVSKYRKSGMTVMAWNRPGSVPLKLEDLRLFRDGLPPFVKFAFRAGNDPNRGIVNWEQKYSLFCSNFQGTQKQYDALQIQDGMIKGLFSSAAECNIVGIYHVREGSSLLPVKGQELELHEIVIADDKGMIRFALRWNGTKYENFQRPAIPPRW